MKWYNLFTGLKIVELLKVCMKKIPLKCTESQKMSWVKVFDC